MTAALLSDSPDCPAGAPNFYPVLQALETAISKDPFWNDMHYPHFLSRSEQIADGMFDVRQQCIELNILVNSPPGSNSSITSNSSIASSSDDGSDSGLAPIIRRHHPASLIKVQRGTIALRQESLRQEQMIAISNLISRWTV